MMMLTGICLVVLFAVAAYLAESRQRVPRKRSDMERIKKYSDRERHLAGLPFE
jgi:hypothetical protein